MRCINNQFLFYVVCKLLRLFTTSRVFFIRHSDDQNVLWNCLYWSIWSDITIAQWLKYRACKPQIPSSNPPWAFVHTYWIKFSKITSSSQIAYFFTCLFCILFFCIMLSFLIKMFFCWFEKLFRTQWAILNRLQATIYFRLLK